MPHKSSRSTTPKVVRPAKEARVLEFPPSSAMDDQSLDKAFMDVTSLVDQSLDDPSPEPTAPEHLNEAEQTSALRIAGYVGRILAARGPLRTA